MQMNKGLDHAMHRHIHSLFPKVDCRPNRLLSFYDLGTATVTLLPESPDTSTTPTTPRPCYQLAVFDTHMALTTINTKQHKHISPKYIFKYPVEINFFPSQNTLTIDVPQKLEWTWVNDAESSIPYSPSRTRTIEAAYQAGDQWHNLVFPNCEYRLDFKKSKQISVATKNERRLLRNGCRTLGDTTKRSEGNWPKVRASIKIDAEVLQDIRAKLDVGDATFTTWHCLYYK